MAAFNSSLPTLGRTEGMFRQEFVSTFGDLQLYACVTRLIPEEIAVMFVCGCLENAGKGLGGSHAQQLWVWGMLIEIFCTITMLQFKISMTYLKTNAECANWTDVKYWKHENWHELKILSNCLLFPNLYNNEVLNFCISLIKFGSYTMEEPFLVTQRTLAFSDPWTIFFS